jgi:hypothetical protein
MNRPTVTFKVPGTLADGTKRWLSAAGEFVSAESEAASFTFYRSPTGRERLAIDREIHRILGDGDEGKGLMAWADLRRAEAGMMRAVWGPLEFALWPEGRPAPKTEDEGKEQQAALNRAYREAESGPERFALEALQGQSDRVAFMARWNVLKVDVPPYFADLSVCDMEDEGAWTLLELAWFESRRKAADDSGKPMPSGS